MRKRALSQHVALVSVKRDRAKEGLRINEGLGAVSSLLRAEMFDRQIGPGGLSRRVLCVGKPRSSVFEFPEASQDVETGCRGRTSQDV